MFVSVQASVLVNAFTSGLVSIPASVLVCVVMSVFWPICETPAADRSVSFFGGTSTLCWQQVQS